MIARHIRILAILLTLYAASTTDTANRPVAILIAAGNRATITQGGAREKPLPTAPGDLIRFGARLITGGERVRFLYFPDGFTYEYTPSFPSYPAPSYQAIDQPNTQFEIRFVTPKPIPQKGKLAAGERFAIQLAGVDAPGVDPAGAGGESEMAALKKIESELQKPANRQDPMWQLARAIALERTNQANRAVAAYQALLKQWTQAAWLRKKIPALQAAVRAADERRDLQTRPSRTYAVIVGISDYQRFSPVDYADNDATLFRSHLRSPRGGS